MNYWERAALLREIAIQEGAGYTAAQILRLYDEALKDIETETKKIQANFQKRFGVDNETASYFLTASQEEENLKTLAKLLDKAPNAKARENILEYIHRDGLSVRAYTARTERYKALEKEIYVNIKKLVIPSVNMLSERLQKTYKESCYGAIDDTAKGLNVGINFAMLNDRAVKEATEAKWHGSRFSERIWKNTDRLAERTQDLIVKSIMNGESWTKTVSKLSEEFEVEKFHAATLVHTETAHIHALANLKIYNDLGIEEYKYLAALDSQTCDICQSLDGKVFKVSETKEGVNFPTLHPRCRCTTAMNMPYESRSARNPLTGKSELTDGSVTYEEWKENLSAEQKSALELAKKKDSRKTADKLQHKQYMDVLGDSVPKTFDKFQDLKYNKIDEWENLKYYYRNINGRPIEYVKIDRELEKMGITNKGKAYPVEDVEIKGWRNHAENRLVKRNISKNEALAYKENAIVMMKRYPSPETQYNYYSDKGVLGVKKDDGVVCTVFSKNEYREDTLKLLEVCKKWLTM